MSLSGVVGGKNADSSPELGDSSSSEGELTLLQRFRRSVTVNSRGNNSNSSRNSNSHAAQTQRHSWLGLQRTRMSSDLVTASGSGRFSYQTGSLREPLLGAGTDVGEDEEEEDDDENESNNSDELSDRLGYVDVSRSERSRMSRQRAWEHGRVGMMETARSSTSSTAAAAARATTHFVYSTTTHIGGREEGKSIEAGGFGEEDEGGDRGDRGGDSVHVNECVVGGVGEVGELTHIEMCEPVLGKASSWGPMTCLYEVRYTCAPNITVIASGWLLLFHIICVCVFILLI